ncbi:hypothetical protein SLE2022_039930 [Rubroshorea leprosula]
MPQTIMLFQKPLKPTDITKRLAIRSKSLEFFPNFNGAHTVQLNIWYEDRVWPMVCSTRKRRYKKPVFSNGWIPFVRRNHLDVGDVVTLYREEGEAGFWYRIEVDRATRAPSVDGNLGVSVPNKAKPKTKFGKAFNNSKKINLGLVSPNGFQEETVLNLDLTLAPPGELSS